MRTSRANWRLRVGAALGAAAFLLSCDARRDPLGSEPRTGIAPRFAAGTTVPATTATVVGTLSALARDTTVRARYRAGDYLEFGTLPPGTPFRLTLSGLDSSGVLLWWSSAIDTTGSSPVKDVLMSLAAVPAAASSLLPAGSSWYKGDTLPVPAGALFTVDGSDPRTSPTARPVLDPKGLAVDSADSIRVAVKVAADPVLGRPELWSPVQDFVFGIDALDTTTTLDTLFLSSMSFFNDPTDGGASSNAVYQAHHDPAVATRVDTLDGIFGAETSQDLVLHLYAKATSPRALVRVGARTILRDAFTALSFPADSQLVVVVENHGRVRDYTVRFVPVPKAASTIKRLDQLRSSTLGLTKSILSDLEYSILLPTGQDSLVLAPSPSEGFLARIGDTLLEVGDSLVVRVGPDTSTVRLQVVRDLADADPVTYAIHVRRPVVLAYRDTTWGVPWRDVAFDTLVYGSRKYRTILVGGVRWMAENLNDRRDSSWCPALTTDSCSKYGRLYSWSAAADTTPRFDSIGLATTEPVEGVCPAGWHLPTTTEWSALFAGLGPEQAATLLRSVGTSWSLAGGIDSVGFRALPAGSRSRSGSAAVQSGRSTDAWFWTSTQSGLSGSQAAAIHLSASTGVAITATQASKSNAYSVRCVEDAPAP